jgi:competence protein ComEC
MNPSELFRTGAQLSFLAAATLIWFGRRQLDRRASLDPLTRLLRSVESPPRRALRATGLYAWLIFVATVAVWLVAAPLMTYRYHLLSPLAMPLAVAVFPLVGASVITGLGVLAAQFVFPPLAPLAATLSGHACAGLERSVHLADAGFFYVPGPALWWVLAAYGLMAVGLRWGARPAVRKGLLYAIPLMILAAFGPSLASGLGLIKQSPRLRCTFLSVGHGVSVLIEAPDGGVVLYDAGSLASPSLATDKISAVLWSKGITRIDAVMLSHADVDHFNGLPGLLERFEVGAVYTSPQTLPRTLLPDEKTAPAELSRLLAAHQVEVQTLTLGDRVRLSEAVAEVLHPTALGVVDTDNANSLVVGIEYTGRRLLLPGDLEGRGLEQLTLQEPYDCDVLLAPHHGSPRSDPPGFAAWCRPEWVVISAAPGVYSESANLSYEEAGAGVLSTAESGAVTFEIDENGIRVETYRP